MSRYDGLIIPRSYSEYINKTDAATLLQALQQSGVMDAAPTEGSSKPAKSGGIYTKLENTKIKVKTINLTNLTLNATGYLSIVNSKPTGMNNFLFALLDSWVSNAPVSIETTGNYLWGNPNQAITRVTIKYWYTD